MTGYGILLFVLYTFVPTNDCLDARSLHRCGGVLDRSVEEASTSAQQALDKSLRNRVGARRARVSVIVREESIDLGLAERLEDVGRVLSMVDEESVGPNGRGHALGVLRKAVGGVGEAAALPGVVGRGAADDDLCALCGQGLAGVGQVRRVREHRDLLAVVGALARLGAGAGARRAPVVARRERAAVVVPELDDDDVVGLHDVDDVVETALDGEGARAAPADGFVDYRQRDRVGEVDSPSCWFCIG